MVRCNSWKSTSRCQGPMSAGQVAREFRMRTDTPALPGLKGAPTEGRLLNCSQSFGVMRIHAASDQRNVDVDITKGGLVLIMVLYHCASVSEFPVLYPIMRRIDFIHSAFLILTGFLCSYHYFPVPDIAGLAKVRQRLVWRTFKLLFVLLLANLISILFDLKNYQMIDMHFDIQNILHLMFISRPDGLIAMEILYLISAFLLLIAILIKYRHLHLALGVFTCLPLILTGDTILFIAWGCSGMLAGIFAKEPRSSSIIQSAAKLMWIFPIILVVFVIFNMNLFKSLWAGLPFPIKRELDFIYILIQTLIWFSSIIWIVNKITWQYLRDQIILIGKYTLIAYIFQMIFARTVAYVIIGIGLRNYSYYALSLVIVTLTTWLAVTVVDQLRQASPSAERIYRAIF